MDMIVEISGQPLVELLMSEFDFNETRAREKARRLVRLVAHGDRAKKYIAELEAKSPLEALAVAGDILIKPAH